MTTTLGSDRIGTMDRRIAIAAVVGLLTVNICAQIGFTLPRSIWGDYLGLAALFGLVAFAAAAPREGLLAAIVLIPVGYPVAVPHTFTTSPSDYLLAGALGTLLVRFWRYPRWDAATLVALAIPALIAGTAALAFALNAVPMDDIERTKFGAAEVAGIGLACSAPLALVLGLRTPEDLRAAIRAGAAALGVTVTFGLIGVMENLACRSAVGGGFFSLPSGRVSGLIGDPNLFGVQVAALAGLAVGYCWTAPRRSTSALLAIGISAAVVVTFSGSRTALATFVVFGLVWMLWSLWSSRARLPALVCLTIVLLSPFVWQVLPCPFSSNAAMLVTFEERTNELEYYHRHGADFEELPTEVRLVEQFDEARLDVQSEQPPRQQEPPVLVEGIAGVLQGVSDTLPLDAARENLWKLTIEVWQTRPYFGVGPASLAESMPNGWRSHNTYLTALSETGLVGLLAVLFSFGLVVMLIFRRRDTLKDHATAATFLGLAAVVALVGAGAQDLLRQPVLWAPIGLLLALVAVSKPPGQCLRRR